VVGRAAGEGPTHVVSDWARLFMADTRGNALLSYPTRSRLHLVGRLALLGTPCGMAIDRVRHRLWVTLTATDQLVELAIDGPSLRLRAAIRQAGSRTWSRSIRVAVACSWPTWGGSCSAD
jgi:hypothetical protein